MNDIKSNDEASSSSAAAAVIMNDDEIPEIAVIAIEKNSVCNEDLQIRPPSTPPPSSSEPATIDPIPVFFSSTVQPPVTTNPFALYEALHDLCKNNIIFFKNDSTDTGQRLHNAFESILDYIIATRELVETISRFAHEYDLDETQQDNGFRSFIKIANCAVNHCIKINSHIMQYRDSIIFRKSHYMKEMEACNHYFAGICTCLQQLIVLSVSCEKGSLFSTKKTIAADLFNTADTVNQIGFYGRCLALHFHESIQPGLKFIAIAMAVFSEAFYKEGGKITKFTSSMWTSGQYYLNPEKRAKRIVNITKHSGVDFCKAFWSLGESNEFMHTLPNAVGPNLKINKIITIPPEPLQLKNIITDEMVSIPVPKSHIGTADIYARLLSYNRRSGMMGERRNCRSCLPKSRGIIFHIHGGGFIATSSRSHQVYLRDWAIELNLPIISIDYNLAPEAPYPRGLEEVFYAYCWVLKNCELLGTTAEKIVLAGDSAGATLNLALTLKCIEMNIRIPDGMFLAYGVVRMSFNLSPSRFLALLDPLVPFGLLLNCMKAYLCPSDEILDKNQKKMAERQNIFNKKNGTVYTGAATPPPSTPSCSTAVPKYSLIDVVNQNSNNNHDNNNNNNNNNNNKNNNNNNNDDVNNNKPIDTTDNSQSINEENSTWEHIDYDNSLILDSNKNSDDCKSPISDTFASASLHSQTIENTDMITPDESNGISFEEDSQPITIHKPIIFDNIELKYETIPATTITNNINNNRNIDKDLLDINDDGNVDDNDDDIYRSQSAAIALEFEDDINGENTVNGEIIKSTPSTPSKYINEFIERYVLDTSIDSNGEKHTVLRSIPRTQSEENILLDESRDVITVENIQNKIYKVANDVASSVSSTLNSLTQPTPIKESPEYLNNLEALLKRNPADEYQFEIPDDPYISPFNASDELLMKMPPINCVTADMDPCMDDSIMLAKKLRKLGVKVNVDILKGLPHGFMNFVKLSKEAEQGNKVCIQRIAELFGMDLPSNENPTKKCC